jgi:hypothetical protein
MTLLEAWRARERAPRSLVIARALAVSPVLAAFPVGIAAVFGFGADRDATADAIAWAYSLGLFASFSVPFWPLPALATWSPQRRVESAVLFFATVSYATHLSWELFWLLLHERIATSADQPWAYLWWAYIDGGDARYLHAPTELVTIEILSVCNGLLGATALARWVRSRGEDRLAPLLMMATAVVHLYSTSYYYLTEILSGMANVDTTSFVDAWIKFGLANAPWLTMPWLVLWWGRRRVLA